ncbi:sigma-54-dependent Fis family transcriptional regulator [Anaeromyxobacter terrae]|uniref:sigma-54-dependent Fis family transcriptional regulator n=1 Tax=Anaeromyxobacter terrae TaxID=2925406 RepID=UPI002436DC1A|nr:sigma 54-interacting transcriptional regulator [Anaeromyxobacter sp. SG22]
MELSQVTERRIDEELALRAVVEGTASETGQEFYRALVRNMALALDTRGAWLTEYDERRDRLRALAFWFGDGWVEGFEYPIAGTPCETAVRERRVVHIPDRVIELYPNGEVKFSRSGVVSYLGVPLLGREDRVLGHLAVVDTRPMPAEKRLVPLFRIFASRALAEMRRVRVEQDLRERQEKLSGLIGSAMDGIVELDGELHITLMNSAAEKVFGCAAAELHGRPADELLGSAATARLRALTGELERRTGGERSLWIPGDLVAEPPGRKPFPAEATLSRFEVRGRPFYTLILRNVDERLEAERRIRALSAEADYLREELAAEHGFDEIVGRSPALRRALQGVAQVAGTDATVLLLGETGTGKELFARAIHDRSARRDRPLVKVNCAAIPATLIESEFFGHERGAFTGATQRRDGRFVLADGGTIFLDEIGELPLELQGKLLRVLQEGELEPVGSSRTRKVNVRVVAATNRDLARAAREGRFRQDLFYRLSVFPLPLPPLRERGDDVVLLAAAMAEKLARALGRRVAPPDAADAAALRSYPWPGNVRELRNVVERAIITSADGRLHLHRALPEAGFPATASDAHALPVDSEVLTDQRVRAIERGNMIAALERAGWRVGGRGGAAALLGVSPSTLKSRMKALAIARPGEHRGPAGDADHHAP